MLYQEKSGSHETLKHCNQKVAVRNCRGLAAGPLPTLLIAAELIVENIAEPLRMMFTTKATQVLPNIF
jgi:hypothetical protein